MSQDNDPSNKPKPTVQNPPQPQPTNVVTTVATETTATTNPPEVLEDTPEAFQKRRDAALAKPVEETTTQTTKTTAEENKGK